jgi:hypothetical protein
MAGFGWRSEGKAECAADGALSAAASTGCEINKVAVAGETSLMEKGRGARIRMFKAAGGARDANGSIRLTTSVVRQTIKRHLGWLRLKAKFASQAIASSADHRSSQMPAGVNAKV